MDEQINNSVQDNTATETAQENNLNTGSTIEEKTITNTNTSTQQENSTDSLESTVESKSEEKPISTPEKYEDFTVPDGFTAPIEKFTEFAKTNNWTQEQAQAAVDFYVNEVSPQMQAQQQAMVKQWETESKKEFGEQGVDSAIRTMTKFATPEFKQFLNETGLGNHKEMIRVFKTISDKISDGSFIDGNSGGGNQIRLYSNSPDMYK